MKLDTNQSPESHAISFIREHALKALINIVLALTVIAFLIYIDINSFAPFYWICGVILTQLLSYYLRRKIPITDKTNKEKIRLCTLINIFDGLIISSCLLFMPFLNDILRTIIIFNMVTVCLGATITTMGYKPFFLAFITPLSICTLSSSFLSAYLWNGADLMYVVTITALLIFFFIYQTSKGIYSNFLDSFLTNIKNIEVNEKLNLAVDEAVKANRSKTRFLASASHDLRQPINTISLFVAALSLKELNDETTTIVKHMGNAVKTIDSQLNSLLEISKLDSGAIEPKISKIDIIPVITDISNIYIQQNSTDKVTIKFTCAIKKIILATDQILLERIINNIVNNSVKYTDEGSIHIFVKVIDSNFFTISVADTGVGIAEKNLSEIYDEFYQENNPAREASEGFGLGLSIVKRLCQLLEIKIHINSVLDEGTQVQLTIPYIDDLSSIS